MNIIHRLRLKKKEADAELSSIKESLRQLRAYLSSSKFNCGDRLDGYVSTAEVINWIRSAEMEALRERAEP